MPQKNVTTTPPGGSSRRWYPINAWMTRPATAGHVSGR